MNELTIVRCVLRRIGQDVAGTTPLARAILGWARGHARWLLGTRAPEPLRWRALIDGVAAAVPCVEPPAHPLAVSEALAIALRLPDAEAALLAIAVAIDRCPRAAALAKLVARHDGDMIALVCAAAGLDQHVLRASAALRLGLVHLRTNRAGQAEIELGWTLERLLDRSGLAGDRLIEAIVGPRQVTSLAPADFAGHSDDIALLARLLRGALDERAAGVNILLHGPPGTGKTELARVLAEAAGAPLHAVAEADEDGEEPTRWDRVTALRLAQRVLAGRGDALLLFDEMEDLIGDARPSGGDWVERRAGSKIFVNRLLETNAAPVIWTTNAIGNIDPAILRRMSFVLRLDLPTRNAGRRMLDRIASEEGIAADAALADMVDCAPQAATVLRVAARTARLSGDSGVAAHAAGSLVRALGGGDATTAMDPVDLDLFETELDLPALFARIGAAGGAQDVSLLLTGPPGTGKTGLAHHLARALDRPLIVKRASDLLSKWVGETEGQIADAFAEARDKGGVLLFDEVDSLLFDRANAARQWEVSQVNELLTGLDRHPLPFVAATNHLARLDPAALRRFVFKLDLRPLGPVRAVRAFERFFATAAPAGLDGLGNLTAGDFAVVARQLRHMPDCSAPAILARLRAEADLKPGAPVRLGF